MAVQRTHIVIPQQLVFDIDQLVGKRGRSRFLALAAAKELKRQRLLVALRRATGSWKDKDHPELKRGSVQPIGDLRRQSDRRF